MCDQAEAGAHANGPPGWVRWGLNEGMGGVYEGVQVSGKG